MKREIKFRGKRTDNNEYVCGDLLQINDKKYIYPHMYGDLDDIDFGHGFVEIFPDSVAQFINVLDSNKTEIYDDDRLLSQAYSTKSYGKNAKTKRFVVTIDYDKKYGRYFTTMDELDKEECDKYRFGQWGDFFDVTVLKWNRQ